MLEQDIEIEFSIEMLETGAGLKKSQIDYEIKLMKEDQIVKRIVDMNDLRKAYYVRGENFDDEWQKS